jgi:DNA helicase-2/ATP-dependent DNA helicase PcrA
MILPHPNAPLGSVTRLPSYSPSDFPSTSAVLCRNTAPLISFAFDLLGRSVACHIVGRDLEVGLLRLADEPPAKLEQRIATLIRKGKKQQAENLSDQREALRVLSRQGDLKDNIKRIFADGSGITLSTIHRAKGLEWETVFLLDWGLLPSRYAETDAAKQQERNLQYVAVTRAKLDLKFINTGGWK